MKTGKTLAGCLPVIAAVLLCGCGSNYAFAKEGLETPAGKAADFLFRPVQNFFSGVWEGLERGVGSVVSAKAYREENRALKKEVAKLQQEERNILSLQAENRRLKALLELQETEKQYKTVACRVIAADAGGITGRFQINKGTNQGIRRDDTVVSVEGLVGTVTAVHKNSAWVTPITDPGQAVGARLVRNGETGVAESKQGVVSLVCFSEKEVPVRGDEIETSGMGGIYPEGILFGTVTEVSREKTVVTPAVNMRSLNEVLVIIGK